MLIHATDWVKVPVQFLALAVVASGQDAAMKWGCVGRLGTDRNDGRTVWIADAHRGDGKRYVARADEKLTAFVELESAIRVGDELP